MSAADQDLDAELRKQAASRVRQTQDPIERLRLNILARGGQGGIKRFAKAFRIMDDNRSHGLNHDEFLTGLRDFGLGLEEGDIQELFKRFDRNGDGTIMFDEFICAIRPPMSDPRKNLVHEAFRKINKNGDKVVDMTDLKGVYKCQTHPKYMSGEWSEKRCFFEWLKKFDDGNDTEDNIKITFEEFLNYYAGISASIDSDAYFDLMMRNAWKL